MKHQIDSYLKYCTFIQKLNDPIQAYFLSQLFPNMELPPNMKTHLPLLKNKKFVHLMHQLEEIVFKDEISSITNSNNK